MKNNKKSLMMLKFLATASLITAMNLYASPVDGDMDSQLKKLNKDLSKIGDRASWNFFVGQNGHSYVKKNGKGGMEIYQNLDTQDKNCHLAVMTTKKQKGNDDILSSASLNMMNVKEVKESAKDSQMILIDDVELFFQTDKQKARALAKFKELKEVCHKINELKTQQRDDSNICYKGDELHIPGPASVIEKRTYPVLEIAKILRGDVKLSESEKKEDYDIKMAKLSGRESWSMRNQSLDQYKGPVRVQVLHWGGDEGGVDLAEKLIDQRRTSGRDVKVYIDTLSQLTDIRNMHYKYDTMRMYYRMMAAGIPVYGFDCRGKFSFPFLKSELNKFKKAISFAKKKDDDPTNNNALRNWRKKMHEKIWTVGDSIAVTGGMNIVNVYFEIAPEGGNYWRDQDMATTGKKAVQDLNETVDQNIKDYVDNYGDIVEAKNMPCFNSHTPGSKEYNDFWQKNVENKGSWFTPKGLYDKLKNKIRYSYSKEKPAAYHFGKENTIDGEVNLSLAILNRLKEGRIPSNVSGKTEYKILNPAYHSVEEYRLIPNRPFYQDLHAEKGYLDLIKNAKKEIIIANSYFMPSEEMMETIRDAAKRGVKITILSNSDFTNDLPVMIPTQRFSYKHLLDVNRDVGQEMIAIYEYTGKDKHGEGNHRRGMYHAKQMIVDDQVYVVGSYNLDNVSKVMNSEVVQIAKSPSLAIEAKQDILKNDLEFSKKISYEDALNFHNPLKASARSALKRSNKMREEF